MLAIHAAFELVDNGLGVRGEDITTFIRFFRKSTDTPNAVGSKNIISLKFHLHPFESFQSTKQTIAPSAANDRIIPTEMEPKTYSNHVGMVIVIPAPPQAGTTLDAYLQTVSRCTPASSPRAV
jgi:hypothetical protein